MHETFQIVDFRNHSVGLGDMLVAIRWANCTPNVVYILPTKARRLATLFEGISAVIVSDDWPISKGSLSHMPKLHQHQDDISAAKVWASTLHRPVAMCINCSKSWKHIRETDVSRWQSLADRYAANGMSVVQFGITENFTPITGAKWEVDLPLRTLAARYGVIGKYVGVDTGDMHLALSVGAKCWIARPPECPEYLYSMWQYNDPRAKYFGFDKIQDIYDSVISG